MLFRQPNWSGPRPCAGSWTTAYVCLLVFDVPPLLLRAESGGSASAARPGTAMRRRSRRPDLVSPFAVDFSAYPLRSVNGAPDSAGGAPGCPESPRQDPPTGAARGPTRSSACRTRARGVGRPCVPRRSGLRPAPGHRRRQRRLDYAVTRKLLRLGAGCLDAVDEVKRRPGVPALGAGTL